MYRVTKMQGKYYAVKLETHIDLETDLDNIYEFATSGDIVIIVDELSSLSDFGIDEDEIEIVR